VEYQYEVEVVHLGRNNDIMSQNHNTVSQNHKPYTVLMLLLSVVVEHALLENQQ